MNRCQKKQPNNLFVIKEFASLPWMFASVFGAPSVLVIFKEISHNFPVSDILGLFLAHYQSMLAKALSFIEPVLEKIVDHLADIFYVQVEINQYWMSIFVISTIYHMANTRTLFTDGYRLCGMVYVSITIIISLATSILAGLILSKSSWLSHALIAGQFGFLVFFGVAVSYSLFFLFGKFDHAYFRPPLYWLKVSVAAGLFGAISAALLSQIDYFEYKAGLASIFVGMLGYGVWWLFLSFKNGDIPTFGFVIRFLGGFIVAIFILLCDLGYRFAS